MNGTEISESKNRKEQKRKSVKCWFFKTISKIGKCLRRLMMIKRSWPFPKSGMKWDISTYLTAVKKNEGILPTSLKLRWNETLLWRGPAIQFIQYEKTLWIVPYLSTSIQKISRPKWYTGLFYKTLKQQLKTITHCLPKKQNLRGHYHLDTKIRRR